MNVVNKILLDLTCRDKRQAQQLVAQWTPQLADVLGEALSDLCNRLDDPAKTLVIDRLELNIGDLTGEGFSGKLQQLKTGLLKSLYEQFNGNTPPVVNTPPTGARQSDPAPAADAASAPQTYPTGAGSMPASLLRAEIPDNIRLMDTADREEQAFYYFLLQGNLPWWQKPADFSFDLILRSLLSRKPAFLLQVLAAAAPVRSYLTVRIVRHATRDTISNLFEALSLTEADLQVLAEVFFTDLQEPVLQKSDAGAFLSNTLDLALDFSSGSHSGSDVLVDILAVRIKTAGSPADKSPAFLDTTAPPSSGRADENPKRDIPEEMRRPVGPVSGPGAPEPDTAALFETLFPQPAGTGEKYATEQAGLVLLAGYLPYFFQQLGIRDEQGFVSEAAQISAMHAVHYLATARTDPPEYALALEKILCGFHPSTPVSFEIPVDPDALEKQANELLDTLIGRWSILKNTPKEAVRSTFLRRNGILERLSEREWVLHVEKGSFDILLNAFPTGVSTSTIAFSWSKFILYVNWERP